MKSADFAASSSDGVTERPLFSDDVFDLSAEKIFA
jgi:hypothetical protein